MQKKSEGDNLDYQGTLDGSKASPEETGSIGSDEVSAGKTDDLRRWLSGEETLLDRKSHV
jgi:hypothetical protein